jgi:hypothetical protein
MRTINRDAFILGAFVASLVTAIEVLWRKFGGHLSGGKYSTAHSWADLREFVPEFMFFFSMTFVGIYLWESIKKKQTTMICPSCEEVFQVLAGKVIPCKVCGTACEPLYRFYERHPGGK